MMEKTRTPIGYVIAAIIIFLSVVLILALSLGKFNIRPTSDNRMNHYANYAVYVSKGGKLPFLEWREKETVVAEKGEKGDIGIHPVATRITPEGHLILIMSNQTEVDAGALPIEMD